MEGGFGGGRKGNGKKACEGLVRACMGNKEVGFEAERWNDVSRIYRRAMGLALGRKSGRADASAGKIQSNLNTAEALEKGDGSTALKELGTTIAGRCEGSGRDVMEPARPASGDWLTLSHRGYPKGIAKGRLHSGKLTANPIPTRIGVEGEENFGSKERIRPIIRLPVGRARRCFGSGVSFQHFPGSIQFPHVAFVFVEPPSGG